MHIVQSSFHSAVNHAKWSEIQQWVTWALLVGWGHHMRSNCTPPYPTPAQPRLPPLLPNRRPARPFCQRLCRQQPISRQPLWWQPAPAGHWRAGGAPC